MPELEVTRGDVETGQPDLTETKGTRSVAEGGLRLPRQDVAACDG